MYKMSLAAVLLLAAGNLYSNQEKAVNTATTLAILCQEQTNSSSYQFLQPAYVDRLLKTRKALDFIPDDYAEREMQSSCKVQWWYPTAEKIAKMVFSLFVDSNTEIDSFKK